eukprot:jgi/Chrzof1/2218/Cz11g07040.t1
MLHELACGHSSLSSLSTTRGVIPEEGATRLRMVPQLQTGPACLEFAASQQQLAQELGEQDRLRAEVTGLHQEKVANQAALKEVQEQRTLAECVVSQLKADKVEMAGKLSVLTQAAAKAKQAAVDRESTLQAKFSDAQASWNRKAAN